MICEDYIWGRYHQILIELKAKHPLDKWKHQPKTLGFTEHKTKLGMATNTGVVLVNKAFIGTDAKAKLDFTIRHEFAHLAAGLHHNHNKVFRGYESYFGADTRIDYTSEIEQVQAKIGYKYTVFAHLENGERKEAGQVHKKTKKYSEYPRDGRLNMSFGNFRVLKFEFILN